MAHRATASVYDIYERPFPLADRMVSAGEDPNVGLQRSTHLQPTETSRLFFGKANIDALQRRLQEEIHARTGLTIDRQSDEELMVVMRYVFVQSGSNEGGSAEVRRLNELVLAEIVPIVGSGVMQYLAYLKDASTLPTPIPRGQATSVKGLKTFEVFKGF